MATTSAAAAAASVIMLFTETILISAALDLLIVGDSTAANYSDDPTSFPRAGWGMRLQDFLDHSAVVVRDLAASGRSSKSYIDENRWADAKANHLTAGDFVFIQFGHNDQKSDADRHTDPFTTYKDYLRIYINDTTQAGAYPVLLTPISRAVWSESGALEQTLGDYPSAVSQLAAEMGVPLIDLNAKTAQLFTQLGQATTQDTLFMCLPKDMFPNYPDGSYDTTHLQMKGARVVAQLAAQGIIDASLPIKQYVINVTLIMSSRVSHQQQSASINSGSAYALVATAAAPSVPSLLLARRFGVRFPDPARSLEP